MKLRLTPLLIVACGLFLLGIFYIFFGGNLGPPVGILVILLGGLCLLPYFILKKILKTSVWRQVITELALLIIIVFGFYKMNNAVILHPPNNYHGYILLIYNVDKQPELKAKNFFKCDIDVMVPATGIIFTSTPYPYNFFNKVVVIDSSQKEVKKLKPGYGIVYNMDTLKCGNKKYFIDVFLFKDTYPGWTYKADSVKRNLKKELACKILIQ